MSNFGISTSGMTGSTGVCGKKVGDKMIEIYYIDEPDEGKQTITVVNKEEFNKQYPTDESVEYLMKEHGCSYIKFK